jgi:hypothetical protein
MQLLQDGRIEVYTFKRGLLSKVAHDLQLRLSRFELRTDGERIEGRFWPESLSVEGAIVGEKLDRQALSDADRRDILGNVQGKILHAARYPEVRFEGLAERGTDRFRVRGELELVGRRVPIELDVVESAGRLSGEVELVPSRWGIEPFKALLGAIKLDDRVLVKLDFAAPSG